MKRVTRVYMTMTAKKVIMRMNTWILSLITNYSSLVVDHIKRLTKRTQGCSIILFAHQNIEMAFRTGTNQETILMTLTFIFING